MATDRHMSPIVVIRTKLLAGSLMTVRMSTAQTPSSPTGTILEYVATTGLVDIVPTMFWPKADYHAEIRSVAMESKPAPAHAAIHAAQSGCTSGSLPLSRLE